MTPPKLLLFRKKISAMCCTYDYTFVHPSLDLQFSVYFPHLLGCVDVGFTSQQLLIIWEFQESANYTYNHDSARLLLNLAKHQPQVDKQVAEPSHRVLSIVSLCSATSLDRICDTINGNAINDIILIHAWKKIIL